MIFRSVLKQNRVGDCSTRRLMLLPTLLAFMFYPATMLWAGGGSAEGIKVHGEWEITVVNPDGSISQHVKFHNALTNPGQQFLLSVLMGRNYITLRESGMPQWDITVSANGVSETDACKGNLVRANNSPQDITPRNASLSLGPGVPPPERVRLPDKMQQHNP